jgi:hypothetical protein
VVRLTAGLWGPAVSWIDLRALTAPALKVKHKQIASAAVWDTYQLPHMQVVAAVQSSAVLILVPKSQLTVKSQLVVM